MEKSIILESVKKLREISKKRNFNQSIDIIVNLSNVDIKKPEQKVDTFMILPYSKGKAVKTCALVSNELATQARTIFDKTITNEEFHKYNDKKLLKQLATDYDFFIAQANLMGQIATVFGKALGPRGKMPNPKAGCVVANVVQLMPLKERLQKTIHLQTKNDVSMKASIGTESMKDDELAENIHYIYNALIHLLPQEKNNIKSILLKTTMGIPVSITEKGPVVKSEKVKEEKKEEKAEEEKNRQTKRKKAEIC